MWNPFKNLFWEKDIFKRAEKLGVKIGSSDGIDYETFCKRVKDSEDSLRSRQAFIISIGSLLVSLVAIVVAFLK
jgi:hypothetical protein